MSPPVKLPPRPVRSTAKSYDDLSAVSALDAADARLRAAMKLADEEANRNQELQNELDTMRASVEIPKLPPPPPIPQGKPISVSAQALTIRGKYWKFTIPFTLLLSLCPLIWTLANDYMQMKRDFKSQTETYAAQAKRIEEVNVYAHEVGNRNSELRETVAQLSGYIAGVLPKAGVKVPGAEPGATFVNVVSDPLPLGEMKKRQSPITVRTPVPAPAPKK